MWVREKFLRWCGGRFAGGGLVVLVCVLMSPSLFQGYFLDDYSHRRCFLGHSDLGPPSQRPVMEMFAFVRDEGHLRPDGGFVQVFDALFRGTDRPMRVGEKVRLKLMDVEVVSLLSDGRPSEARFRFRVPLEDPRLVFLRGGKTALLRWKPPSIGEHTILQGGSLFPW